MSNYIINIILFQILFIGIYELLFKKETFFNINRFYLIGSFLLSLALPLIQIPLFESNTPQLSELILPQEVIPTAYYPMDIAEIHESQTIQIPDSKESSISVLGVIYTLGVIASFLLFLYKLNKLFLYRKFYKVENKGSYNLIKIPNEDFVFSFLNSIYIGEKHSSEPSDSVINHELTHIKQKHSYDLLLFEIFRIVLWFNPLVYVFQNKLSECHEYIADRMAKSDCNLEQYNVLLQQIFSTEKISFINSFYKKSLVKKRLSMILKSDSDRKMALKYMAILPLILSMLIYSSCKNENSSSNEESANNELSTISNENSNKSRLTVVNGKPIYHDYILKFNDVESIQYHFTKDKDSIAMYNKKGIAIDSLMIAEIKVVKFTNSELDVPKFNACENSQNPKECFQQEIAKYLTDDLIQEFEKQSKGENLSFHLIITSEGEITYTNGFGKGIIKNRDINKFINSLPKIEPGKLYGEKIDVSYILPVIKQSADNKSTFDSSSIAEKTFSEKRIKSSDINDQLNQFIYGTKKPINTIIVIKDSEKTVNENQDLNADFVMSRGNSIEQLNNTPGIPTFIYHDEKYTLIEDTMKFKAEHIAYEITRDRGLMDALGIDKSVNRIAIVYINKRDLNKDVVIKRKKAEEKLSSQEKLNELPRIPTYIYNDNKYSLLSGTTEFKSKRISYLVMKDTLLLNSLKSQGLASSVNQVGIIYLN